MLGTRITERMGKLGIKTQADLAERSGLSPQMISALITGKRGAHMRADTAQRLSRALRVSQKFFLSESTSVENRDQDPTAVDGKGAQGYADHG